MLSASIRPAKYFSTVYIFVHVSFCWVFYCVFIFLLFSLFGYYSINIIYAAVIISGHVITSPASQAGTRFTYSGGDQRLVVLGGWLDITEMVHPPTDGHPPVLYYNRAAHIPELNSQHVDYRLQFRRPNHYTMQLPFSIFPSPTEFKFYNT